MNNHLYYGDNLHVLRESIADGSVDLVYLDPPFNSNANYNVLFKSPEGTQSHAQIEAFEDTWHWTGDAEQAFDEVMQSGRGNAAEMLRAMRSFLGENDMMAYLTMMAVRLIELHRVLKDTGSLYLHCDPTASHYLKIILDGIFGAKFFKNEITWKRKTGRGETNHKSNKFGTSTDILLFYAKTDKNTFNTQFNPDAPGYEEYVEGFFTHVDDSGRRYAIDNLASPSLRKNLIYDYKGFKPPKNGWAISLDVMKKWDEEGKLHFPANPEGRIRRKRYADELKGRPVQNLWDDIDMISSQSEERLGYPTQKPVALLERILSASSNEGDVVLDPFCGCGTTIHAAQKLNRQWIGIDITHLSIGLIEKRLRNAFPDVQFETHGTPKDLAGAQALAAKERGFKGKHEFQKWAVSMLDGAQPYRDGKKGADGGIDGLIYFKPDGKATEKAIVSIKGGHVGVPMIRELINVVDREKAKIGVFVSLEPPTKPMLTEAAAAGFYTSPFDNRKYPKLQILTIEEIFAGKQPAIPLVDSSAFKKAAVESTSKQSKLL